MSWYHWHRLQSLIVDHHKHLVLAIDKTFSKIGFNLNVVTGARDMESEVRLFDAGPCVHIFKILRLEIETWMARENHICDQGFIRS